MKKLATSKNRSPWFHSAISILSLIPLFFSGCTGKPFGSSIEKNLRPPLESGYTSFVSKTKECTNSFDGDITINWEDSLHSFAFSGFFRTMLPSSFHLSILNPLGQPLFAAASNGKHFQSVDTTKRVSTSGSLRSYAAFNDISYVFLSGAWGLWLSGRPLSNSPYLIDLYNDQDNRGIWFSVSDQEKTTIPNEYILLDLNETKMLERIILDKKGKTAATITYANWVDLKGCSQPYNVSVTGLSYGAELHLKLSDVQNANLTTDDFRIIVPPNYVRKMMP